MKLSRHFWMVPFIPLVVGMAFVVASCGGSIPEPTVKPPEAAPPAPVPSFGWVGSSWNAPDVYFLIDKDTGHHYIVVKSGNGGLAITPRLARTEEPKP